MLFGEGVQISPRSRRKAKGEPVLHRGAVALERWKGGSESQKAASSCQSFPASNWKTCRPYVCPVSIRSNPCSNSARPRAVRLHLSRSAWACSRGRTSVGSLSGKLAIRSPGRRRSAIRRGDPIRRASVAPEGSGCAVIEICATPHGELFIRLVLARAAVLAERGRFWPIVADLMRPEPAVAHRSAGVTG